MEAVQILQMLITSKRGRFASFKMGDLQENVRGSLRGDVQSERLDRIATSSCASWPTLVAAEVWQSHILQRDLLQEAGTLAAGVAGHDLPAPQPIAEPGQTAVAVKGVRQEVALVEKQSVRKAVKTHTHTHSIKHASGDGVRLSQGGKGLKSVKGSRSDGGQLVVIQRQQADIVQPGETVVMDAADLVVSQHPEEKRRTALQFKHSRVW